MQTSLKEELAKLKDLQAVDTQLLNVRREAEEEKPALIAKLKQECEAKKEKLRAWEEKLKAAQLKRKDKELKLKTEEENIKKATAQLYQLKTNKEYKAKLNEIESLKGNVSLLEEEILRAMDEAGAVEQETNSEKQYVQRIEREFQEKEAALRKEIEELNVQIRILADKRKALAVHVPKEILALYEDILKNRGGLAVVPVRNNSCGGCYLRVTHQAINEIRMYSELIRCSSCARLLYVEEDADR